VADIEYKKAFADELSAFKVRIRTRAKQKVQEQMEEMEEEERRERLGPGGLDPVEVFDTLPKVRSTPIHGLEGYLLTTTCLRH
jgi:cell division cycle protein 37